MIRFALRARFEDRTVLRARVLMEALMGRVLDAGEWRRGQAAPTAGSDSKLDLSLHGTLGGSDRRRRDAR